jgi:hypothetical protein
MISDDRDFEFIRDRMRELMRGPRPVATDCPGHLFVNPTDNRCAHCGIDMSDLPKTYP